MGVIYALIGTYCIIWFVLLWKLIGKTTIYPILFNSTMTKLFWILTFFLFNPLLTGLFVLFGLLLKPSEHPKFIKPVRVICLGLASIIIIFCEWPFGTVRDEVLKLASSEQKSSLSSHLRIDVAASSDAKVNTSASYYGEGYFFTDRKQIAIINESTHPILSEVGRKLANHLKTLPGVELVTYIPSHSTKHHFSNFPGLLIELHENSISGAAPSFGSIHTISVQISVSTPRSAISRWSSLPMAHFTSNVSLETGIAKFGIFSPSMKYHSEANNLLNKISLIATQSRDPWPNFAPLPELPDYLYGEAMTFPELPIQPDNITLQISGSDLLAHNTALIRFRPDGTPKKTFEKIQTVMEQRGWRVNKKTDDALKMTRESEQLYVNCRDSGFFNTFHPPMVARYINPFKAAEIDTALKRFMKDEQIDAPTLLIFSPIFRKEANAELFAQFSKRLSEQIPFNLYEAIELGFIAEKSGQPERAKKMLNFACAYNQMQNAPQAQWAMDDLADSLGNRSLSKKVPDPEFLEKSSILPWPTDSFFEIQSDVPLQFYSKTETEGVHEYITFKVIDSLWPIQPKGLHINELPSSRTMYIFGRSERGFSSFHQTGGRIREGRWSAKQNNLCGLIGNEPISIAIEESENGEYRWSIKVEGTHFYEERL